VAVAVLTEIWQSRFFFFFFFFLFWGQDKKQKNGKAFRVSLWQCKYTRGLTRSGSGGVAVGPLERGGRGGSNGIR
jgi:hypothetical protein